MRKVRVVPLSPGRTSTLKSNENRTKMRPSTWKLPKRTLKSLQGSSSSIRGRESEEGEALRVVLVSIFESKENRTKIERKRKIVRVVARTRKSNENRMYFE